MISIKVPSGVRSSDFTSVPIWFGRPIVVAAGYDPVWYGILVVLLMETALLTPPVGMNLFVVQGIRERGDLNDVIIGTAPFIVTLFVMIGLIVAFPGIAMWLPNLLN